MRPIPSAFRRWPSYLTADHRRLTKPGVAVLVVVAAVLAVAAATGVAWTAGFRAVLERLTDVDTVWLAVAVGGVAVSYVGYLFAYREVVKADGGPQIKHSRLAAMVIAGFGVFIPRGGFTVDADFWCDHGISPEEASKRVLTLAVLEYALLAPATLAAAIVLLGRHFHVQAGLLPSWVIGVPAGTAVTLGLLWVQRRVRWRTWAWRRVSHWLDAIRLMFTVLRRRPAGPLAVVGMAVYWAGDMAALGACFHAVGASPSVPALIVGYATGYALTRRSLPLAGAGAVEALLPFALSWVALPLASAVLAVFAYRLFNLWMPVAPAAAGFRHLRRNRPRGRAAAAA